jgi:hypothetical protein
VKKFFVVLTMVLFLSGAAFAGEINLSSNQSGLKIVTDKMSGKDGMTIKMNCSMNKLHFYDAKTPKGDFTVLYSPEFYFGGHFGAPQLPVITKLVQIPFGADFKVEVKSYDEKEYKLADYGISTPVFPRQPSAPKDGSEVPFMYEKSAYISKGFHGQQLATIKEAGVMRHMRLAHVTIAPVKYDATANKIVVYNNIKFEVVITGADMKTTKAKFDTQWSPAFSWMNQKVLSPKALKFKKRNAKQTYVIVAHPSFKEAIQPFADWKTEKGFNVELVYTDKFGTGETLKAGLKDYIHGLYNNATAEKPAPSYVLFVGDHEQIPAFRGKTSSHITDLYYVAVTPGDFIPDILTGRFSAQTVDQLIPQVEKTIEYEKFAFADPSFLDDVVLVAGWDSRFARSHGWPHIKYAKKYYINKDNGFKNIPTYLSAGSHQNEKDIIANISKGSCYVNYTAHGSSTSWADPRLTISNINSLKNKGKYPFIIGNCCLTNKFEVSTCFGEAWLRAKDCGAIGYVGGSNSTYWDEDIWWGVGNHSILKPNNDGVPPLKEKTGVGAFEAMFENGVCNAGFMLAGNLAVEESTSPRKHYYWEVYHIMGDPSVKTYMGQPTKMSVNHTEKMATRSSSVKVSAPNGSYVGISHNGKLLGAGYVTANNNVEISLNSVPATGKAKVVVTAGNKIPYIGTINITK